MLWKFIGNVYDSILYENTIFIFILVTCIIF